MKRSHLLILASAVAAGLAFAAGTRLAHRLPDIKDSTGAVTLPNVDGASLPPVNT